MWRHRPRGPAGFFSQFGDITRLRLSRNKQGASKHYAYIEFRHADVARIVADTMNNYLMFEKLLQVRVLAPSEVHEDTFKGANRPFKPVPWRALAREAHERPRSAEECAALAARILRNERGRRRRIAEAGIDYEFPGYEAQLPPKSKKRRFEEEAEAEEGAEAGGAGGPKAAAAAAAARAAAAPVQAAAAAAKPAAKAAAAVKPAAAAAKPAAAVVAKPAAAAARQLRGTRKT